MGFKLSWKGSSLGRTTGVHQLDCFTALHTSSPWAPTQGAHLHGVSTPWREIIDTAPPPEVWANLSTGASIKRPSLREGNSTTDRHAGQPTSSTPREHIVAENSTSAYRAHQPSAALAVITRGGPTNRAHTQQGPHPRRHSPKFCLSSSLLSTRRAEDNNSPCELLTDSP